MDPDQLISFHTVSVSKNRIYLGSAGQGLIWYLHKCIYYNIVTLFILTSIRFYFTLLAGNFLIFLSSAVFFKINLLYSSQRVKQFGFRSGPIFCWSWFGSKTVCKGYQQTTIAGRVTSAVFIYCRRPGPCHQLAGYHLFVCLCKQSRKQYTSWSAGFRTRKMFRYFVICCLF